MISSSNSNLNSGFLIENSIILVLFLKKLNLAKNDDLTWKGVKYTILFDIGSGDGAQLIAIKETFPNIRVIASDNNEFALNNIKKLDFENYKLNTEDETYKILEKIKPNFISIFEVLEHLKSPE